MAKLPYTYTICPDGPEPKRFTASCAEMGAALKGGDYVPKELVAPAVRVGADDHMQHPSRTGNTLTYRNGRQEKL